MYRNVEANTIILMDEDDVYIEPLTNITLQESKDNKIYFSDIRNEFCLCNTTLKLFNYNGKLVVPRHTGIQIVTNKDINGFLASPCYIKGSGKIELEIAKDSGLELCLCSNEKVMINDKTEFAGITPVSTGKFNIGRPATYFQVMYDAYIIKHGLPSEDVTARYNIDVCTHFNLVQIEKDGGITNLQYTYLGPDNSEHEKFRLMNAIRRQDIALKAAIIEEKYDMAAFVKDRIGFLTEQFKEKYPEQRI